MTCISKPSIYTHYKEISNKQYCADGGIKYYFLTNKQEKNLTKTNVIIIVKPIGFKLTKHRSVLKRISCL